MEWFCSLAWWEDFSAILRNLAIVGGGAYGLWLARSRTRALDRQADTQSRQADNQQRQAELDRQQHELEVLRELTAVLTSEQSTSSERIAAIWGMSMLAGTATSGIGNAVADVFLAYRSECEKRTETDPGLSGRERELELVEAYLFEWVERGIESEEEPNG